MLIQLPPWNIVCSNKLMFSHAVKFGVFYGKRSFAAVFTFSYREPDKTYSLS